MEVADSWMHVGGGPTADKPDAVLSVPDDSSSVSAFLNLRVAGIAKAYEEASAAGAIFHTEPKNTAVRSGRTCATRTDA